MADPQTLAWYERMAPRIAANGACGPSRHLDPFLDRLPPGARVLELGCGTGGDAARMMARGFDVEPTDGSPAMARRAAERLGRPVVVLTFAHLEAMAAYDAVWAHASLLHAATAQLPAILRRIARALVPGGWHYANYKLGTGEGRDRFGRLHNFPTEAALRTVYAAVPGWRMAEIVRYAGEAADGTERDWLALTVQTGAPAPTDMTPGGR